MMQIIKIIGWFCWEFFQALYLFVIAVTISLPIYTMVSILGGLFKHTQPDGKQPENSSVGLQLEGFKG